MGARSSWSSEAGRRHQGAKPSSGIWKGRSILLPPLCPADPDMSGSLELLLPCCCQGLQGAAVQGAGIGQGQRQWSEGSFFHCLFPVPPATKCPLLLPLPLVVASMGCGGGTRDLEPFKPCFSHTLQGASLSQEQQQHVHVPSASACSVPHPSLLCSALAGWEEEGTGWRDLHTCVAVPRLSLALYTAAASSRWLECSRRGSGAPPCLCQLERTAAVGGIFFLPALAPHQWGSSRCRKMNPTLRHWPLLNLAPCAVTAHS